LRAGAQSAANNPTAYRIGRPPIKVSQAWREDVIRSPFDHHFVFIIENDGSLFFDLGSDIRAANPLPSRDQQKDFGITRVDNTGRNALRADEVVD